MSRNRRVAPLVLAAIMVALAGCSASHPKNASPAATTTSATAAPTRVVPVDSGTPGGAQPPLAADCLLYTSPSPRDAHASR
ncbi:lytic transglycosylase domain-containing protein, partial [Mycobacterium intracellulare]